jgi:8-oxo-dGTP diphosphatase
MVEDHSKQKPIIKAASACVWRRDDVLLVQRGKALGYGLWSLPGGTTEPGETNVEAALRELLEETNIIASLAHHVGDFDAITPDAHYIISCFTGHYSAGTAQALTDAKAVAWVNWQEIETYRLATNIAAAVRIARKLISL